MSFFTYDPKQAGSGFEALPVGDYEAVVSGVEVKTSSTGNPMLTLTLTIRDDVAQEGQKRKVFDHLVQTEKAMFKFHQVAKALGWGEGDKADTLADFARKVQFQAVCINLKQEEYNGNLQNRVTTYKPATVAYGGQGGQQLDPFAMDGKPIDISDDNLPF